MKSHSTTETERDIVVVSATDDGYAMPLAVTIRSALDHLRPTAVCGCTFSTAA